jgi:hypothetical protein
VDPAFLTSNLHLEKKLRIGRWFLWLTLPPDGKDDSKGISTGAAAGIGAAAGAAIVGAGRSLLGVFLAIMKRQRRRSNVS